MSLVIVGAGVGHCPSKFLRRPVKVLTCFFSVLLLILFGPTAVSAEHQLTGQETALMDTDSAVQASCGKRIALLGESPTHGFGNTLQFKAQLVRRLVKECHFNAFVIESGMYDFIHIERELKSGKDVTDATISAAIGGVWANQEVQALVPFLRGELKAGTLTLAGLDDQIGAGTYASHEMSADLAQYLQNEERSRCLAILERHMSWQYTAQSPYGPSDKANIVSCLNKIAAALSQTKEDARSMEVIGAMVNSLQRNFARDFTEDDFTKKDQQLKWINDRDHSMYLNLRWLLGCLPRHSKIIVWAATVHTAKSLNGVEGFEGRVPLGDYVKRDFGDAAFSLGFSAFSGDYAFVRQSPHALSDAPASSLEGEVFAHSDSDVAYLSIKRLRKYGMILGAPFGNRLQERSLGSGLRCPGHFPQRTPPAWIRR